MKRTDGAGRTWDESLLPCACALAVGVAACADPTARREILRNNETLFHAIAARDVATLAVVAAPDFRFEHQGQKGDRRAWLEAVAAPSVTIESISNDDLRLRIEGDHAILCGVQHAVVLVGGERVTDRAEFCDRWERRDGQWRVTFAGEPATPRR